MTPHEKIIHLDRGRIIVNQESRGYKDMNEEEKSSGLNGFDENTHLDKGRCLSCDEVSLILDVFERYLPEDKFPRVSQQREMKKYGMLYEIMDVARLSFTDSSARYNATPRQASVLPK